MDKMLSYTGVMAAVLIYINMFFSFTNSNQGLSYPMWIQILLLVGFLAALLDSVQRKAYFFCFLFVAAFVLVVISIIQSV